MCGKPPVENAYEKGLSFCFVRCVAIVTMFRFNSRRSVAIRGAKPEKLPVQKSILTILLMASAVFFLWRCTSDTAAATDVRGRRYAGSAACTKCHANTMHSYTHTAHFKTSARQVDSLLQGLAASTDSFAFPSETVYVGKKGDGFFQTAVQRGKAVKSARFDVAFGAGSHAYSFAYWKENELFQLPLSYFRSVPGWANSPGFPAARANFDRAIITRCFECHASYAEKEFVQAGSLSVKEKFHPASIIYGIDCERCHGAAAEHVQFHTAHPQAKEATYLTRWASLSRQQKLDACAVCHSGNDLETQRSTFGFEPGDTLANFYLPAFASSASPLDVHGKQLQLMMASACYKKSTTLECSSCHNAHEAERDKIALFSQRCITCHQSGSDHFCKTTTLAVDVLEKDCVNCHMPLRASKTISFQKAGAAQTTPYFLRTHTVAVYPDETAKVLAAMKANTKSSK